MKDQIKQSGTLLASIGTLGGFIADVLTPLGPFTKWIFIIFIVLTIFLFITYLKNRSFGKKYFPVSLILSTIFGFLFLINGDSKSGVLGDNIDGISSMQNSLFNLQESVDRIEDKIDVVNDKLELGFDKIEELINSNNPIENPSTANDHIVNAYLYKSTGMLQKSQFSFEEYLRISNNFKIDILLDYCEVFESNNGFMALKKQISFLPKNDVTRVISLIKNSIDKKELVMSLFNDTINDPDLVKWAILMSWQADYTLGWLESSHFFEYGYYMFTSHVSLGYYCENIQHYFFNNSKAHELILTNTYEKKPLYFNQIDWKRYYPDLHINQKRDDGKPWEYSNPFFPHDYWMYKWSTKEYQIEADELEKLYLEKREEGWFR